MFKPKKRGREKLFEQAMLARKERPTKRRAVPGESEQLPWVSVSLWMAFLLVSGYVLLFSPMLMVQRVSIQGESVIPSEEYVNFVESNLDNAYFGIFKKRNYFLVPSKEIVGGILERYPLLSDVQVERQFPDTVSLLLREAPALLRWCSGGPCYGVRNGRAVLVPYSEDDRYASSRLSVIDESALIVQVDTVLPVESYLEVFRVTRDGLSRLIGGEVSSVATTPSRHSDELTLLTSEGWRLLVAVNRPAEVSLGALSVFLDEYKKDHPDRSGLDSIDLRVEGKVFYAESGQSTEEAEAKPGKDDLVTPPNKEDSKKKKKSGE